MNKRILKQIVKIQILLLIMLLVNVNKSQATENDNSELDEGLYRIKSAQNTNLVFDIAGASKQAGASLSLWCNFYAMNQEFYVNKLNDGSYEIIARHSGQTLDVYNNSYKEGTNLEQYINFHQDNQKFYIIPTNDGYYNIVCKHSGLYFDVSTGNAELGSKIQTYKNNNSITQKFIFEKVEIPTGQKNIEEGNYYILPFEDEGKALTVKNASFNNCAALEINDLVKSFYQRFKFKYNADGTYTIQAVHSGKMLDVYNNDVGAGTVIEQYVSNGGNNQKWIVNRDDDGSISIISKSNELFLSIAGSLNSGTNIYCNGQNLNEKYRKFKLVPVEKRFSDKVVDDGIYTIKSTINDNLCLDIPNNSMNLGTPLGLWTENGGKNQKFRINYVDGFYKIIAVHSEKSLDVFNGNITPDTNIIQWLWNGQSNQQWIITKLDNGNYKICSRKSELFLKTDDSVKNGSRVYVGKEEDSSNQEFILEKDEFESMRLEEKCYKISSAMNQLEFLDVANASNDNNANVLLWFNQRRTNQIFEIKYVDNKYFKISIAHSKKYLTTDGENVYQYDEQNNDSQLWKAIKNDDNTYTIISKKYEKAITADGSAANGNNVCLKEENGSQVERWYLSLITNGETGTYGKSGLYYQGDSRGQDLKYYKYGCGENVYFATFTVHGFEDNWNWDGSELQWIANNFYNKLVNDKNEVIAKNWTIYIFPTVNPDGLSYGNSNNGPGRTTFYSSSPTHQGIDINRCWQTESTYKTFTSSRNYNGTSGFQAYEAAALRDFLLKNKSTTGRTILVDLHGWENSLIGSTDVLTYFANYFPDATKKYERYGQQYLITWGRYVLGAQVGLVELPTWIASHNDVVNADISGKYISSCLNMLNGISVNNRVYSASMSVSLSANIGNNSNNSKLDEFGIATAGAINNGKPTLEQVEDYKNLEMDFGVYIIPGYEDRIIKLINSVTNNEYGINENNYLVIVSENANQNKYDNFWNMLINSKKCYLISSLGELYFRDEVTNEIVSNIYEFMDAYQTYDYVQYEDKMLLDIPKNSEEKLNNTEIMDSLIELIGD